MTGRAGIPPADAAHSGVTRPPVTEYGADVVVGDLAELVR